MPRPSGKRANSVTCNLYKNIFDMGSQLFCLKWNNHQTNMLCVFDQLLKNEAFVDVTIACDGMRIKAHKMVLSACSPYFQDLFLDNPCKHPIVILKDIKYTELQAVIDFMYKGEINVSQDQLSGLLKTAESLKIKGLAEVSCSSNSSSLDVPANHEIAETEPARSPRTKKKKKKKGHLDQGLTDVALTKPACTPPLAHSATDSSSIVSEPSPPHDLSDATPPVPSRPPSTNHIPHIKHEPSKGILSPVVPPDPDDNGPEDLSDPSGNSNEDTNQIFDENDELNECNMDYLVREQCFQDKDGSTSYDNISPTDLSLASTSNQHSLGLYRKSKKSTWTVQDLMKAINAVRSGQMNVLKAAITFGIPKSSLYDYISGRTGVRLRLVKKMKPSYPIVTITELPASGDKQTTSTTPNTTFPFS